MNPVNKLACNFVEYTIEILRDFKTSFIRLRHEITPSEKEVLVQNFKVALNLYKAAKNRDISAITPEIAMELTIMELDKDEPDVQLLGYLADLM